MKLHIRTKTFGDKPVLGEIAFEIDDGEFVALVGNSGVGKTTLLRIVAGLDRDFVGSRVAPQRIGVVFQEPRLLPWHTVAENVLLATDLADGHERATQSLAEVGLAGLADAYPRTLSLGQSRRASLARALASGAELLLLDEPFVSLDESAAEDLRSLLDHMWRKQHLRILLITHDIEEASRLAQRVLVVAGSPARLVADLATGRSGSFGEAKPAVVEQIRNALR